MSPESMVARIARLEEFRDDSARPRLLDHAQRIRTLELAWAKVAGAVFVGTSLGGFVAAIAFNVIGGHS